MANYKGPSEGGSGGKRGHSTMEHWTSTEEIKKSSKIQRSSESRIFEKEALESKIENSVCDECGSEFFASSSEYKSLCCECAHWIYGSLRCNHNFLGGCCEKCGWDGSVSSYIEYIKKNA